MKVFPSVEKVSQGGGLLSEQLTQNVWYNFKERKNNGKKLSWRIKRIGVDMVEIGEGQKRITEG
uniref:Uncharacterized protein n=1 Tax=Salix viminalis TaxID=40686 RepID=A0A6N2LK30_SALVM